MSRGAMPGSTASRSPSAPATAGTISESAVIGASSTSHTPSATSSRCRPTASRASRVFPAPPGPRSVTSRRALEQVVDLAELTLAADEARHRRGQVRALRGRRLGLEHGEVRLLELGRGRDAELVVQPPARAFVDRERIGLAAGGEQRADQPRREPLVQRVLGVQRLQRPQVAALDQRRDALLLQPGGGLVGEAVLPQVRERRPAPQLQVAGALELLHVRLRLQPVAARRGRDQRRVAERAPQPRDERLQRVHVISRELVLPHGLDERAGGHGPPGVQRQPGEQRTQPPAADRDRVSIVLDLERPEQPYAHPPTVAG